MTTPKPTEPRSIPKPYIAAAAVHHVTTAALALRCNDHLGAVTAAKQAIHAAQDPIRALLAAAALIDPDQPMRRWWDPPAKGARRCTWCDRPIFGRRDRRRQYCRGTSCFEDARRAYWRKRDLVRKAAREATSTVAS